jgi:hypothetical protein
MNRNSKSLFTLTTVTLTGLAAVAVLSFPQVTSDDKNIFCGDIENIVINHELPVSHPINKCATEQAQGISWSEWFTGRSSSYQFHFIDLLELLSRSGNSEAKNPTNTSSVNNSL